MRLLPLDKETACKNLKWYRGDDEAKYKQNIAEGKIPDFGPDDVSYDFNSLGFRCQEFGPRLDGDFRVGMYGCSLMEGYGLPAHKTISAQFSDLLCGPIEKPVDTFNLGKAAISNDRIAEIIHGTVPLLKPDLVVVYWTYFSRRDIYTEDGEVMKWISNWKNWSESIPERRTPLFEAQSMLCSNSANVSNFVRNFLLVKYYLKTLDIPMVWGLANGQWINNVGQYLDSEDLQSYANVDAARNTVDYARDMEHPGVVSAILIAKKFRDAYLSIRS